MRKIKSFKDIKLSEKKDFGLNDQNIIDINNTCWDYLNSLTPEVFTELEYGIKTEDK